MVPQVIFDTYKLFKKLDGSSPAISMKITLYNLSGLPDLTGQVAGIFEGI